MEIEIEKMIENEFNPTKKDKYIPIFEEKISDFFATKYAIAVSSGTAALHVALAALNIEEGDEVLVPANAVIMSIIPVLYQRAIPIFVDCKEDSIDFDYDDLEKKISRKTKAIIPVYLWGCSYNMDKLLDFSKKHNIYIIEDACQAHGSKWNNKYLGTYGEIGCFSMKNGKLLATGEGGFILTNNEEIAERCKFLRNHCTNVIETEKSFSEIGWNYRITEMQAFLGIYNLKKLKNKIDFRREQTKYIYKKLSDVKLLNKYKYFEQEDSNYFSPVFFCENGKDIAKKISNKGIINSTGTFGLIPANERKVFCDYCKKMDCYDKMNIINSHNFFNTVIAISLMENMNMDKLDEIVLEIKKCLEVK